MQPLDAAVPDLTMRVFVETVTFRRPRGMNKLPAAALLSERTSDIAAGRRARGYWREIAKSKCYLSADVALPQNCSLVLEQSDASRFPRPFLGVNEDSFISAADGMVQASTVRTSTQPSDSFLFSASRCWPMRCEQPRQTGEQGRDSRLGQFRSTFLTRGCCTSSPRNCQDPAFA